MAFNTQNISNDTATKVTGASINSLKSILLCNIHSSSINVDLYIQNTTDNQVYYILKSVDMPVGATLLVEDKELIYDRHFYDLYVKSSNASGYISIIIN
tara:strand:+ start:388 stop:684 length:297 start_codon:yes stop_codon:yes gene_type:complete